MGGTCSHLRFSLIEIHGLFSEAGNPQIKEISRHFFSQVCALFEMVERSA
jgi:hypothetical protein